MATKKKVTDLNSASDLNNADVLHIVDVSDTSQGPAGSSKKTTIGAIKDQIEAGLDVSDKSYSQAFNASTVVVTHNLGKRPSVTVVNSAGDEVEGQVTHDSANQCTLVFSGSFVGTVYCN